MSETFFFDVLATFLLNTRTFAPEGAKNTINIRTMSSKANHEKVQIKRGLNVERCQ